MGAFSTTGKNKLLDGGLRGTGGLAGQVWAKLHTADPGSAGTTAPAGNTTRKQVTLAAASSGSCVSSAEVRWSTSEVNTNETYTHVSFWDASAAGNFIGSDDLPSSVAVTAGDEFFIASGDISLSLT